MIVYQMNTHGKIQVQNGINKMNMENEKLNKGDIIIVTWYSDYEEYSHDYKNRESIKNNTTTITGFYLTEDERALVIAGELWKGINCCSNMPKKTEEYGDTLAIPKSYIYSIEKLKEGNTPS
ncbi:hypothetical protein DW206_08905 [Bacteroides ovatus]|jgi:hypothetical protein|uniref:Uncharacterized protein n=2 Tax=Bacteroides ovatus TaxID=28116 RepID=A0A414X4P6_BACOV|nr:hypothetical protein DW206_08905 [Bacteroides ovatus]